ncbi:D-alanine--D-alanine ligase family protein [Williamsia sp. Leaf354]|uniref:D-alanine--D-alanine ligase family protein n=1 Tax=Williamsia sp. Leaf354 TaxID=1736349 RepID=UPI000A7A06F0|nr:D-alanine--D-alanine ligase [Williamsia sp. Leaf354]
MATDPVTDVPTHPERTLVLHLVGSPVDEAFADLSRLYASGCLAALRADTRYDNRIAHVAPGGRWSFPDDLTPAAIAAAEERSAARALEMIESWGVDVVVPQMFCRPGMTSYRSVFDVLGIGRLGNSGEVMAIAADKAATRAIVAAAGVAVPDGEVVRRGDAPTLSLPVVVKPVDADNSDGVTLVRDASELPAALDTALALGDSALVESFVELGREVRCGIIVRDGELVCLPLEEYAVDAETKPIRDRADKLARSDDGDLFLVAKDAEHAWIVDDDDPIVAVVHEAARRCHRALGCRHHSLFDFRIDPDGTPFFLEAGPYCSFAPGSVIAVMAKAAGIGLDEVFAIALAELRAEQEKR